MTSQQDTSPDVCVIGAGIMGLSAAWQLAQRGRRVVCIDRRSAGREATGATAGTLAVQNKVLGVVPLVLRAVRLWEDLGRQIGFGVEYERRGGLRVAHTDDQVLRLQEVTAEHSGAGAPLEMVYGPQLFRLAPYLSRDAKAASYCAEDGMANPFAAVRGLVRACRRAGVKFITNTEIVSVAERADRSAVVHTASGDIVCRRALVATGAWIPGLAASIGMQLPIVTRIQHVLITDAGSPLFPHVVTHVRENLTLKQQRMTGKVLVGGGWTGQGDRDTGERRLVRENVRANAEMAISVVPRLAAARLLRAWTGFEGRTPDRLPIMGPLYDRAPIHVLGCASGGFTLGPICGLMAAQLLTGEQPVMPVQPFLVSRFAAPRTAEHHGASLPAAAAGPAHRHAHGS